MSTGRRTLLLALVGVILIVVVATVAAAYPTADRWLLSIVLGAALCTAAARSGRGAVVLVLGFLPFLGLVRRLLIVDAGWSSSDPLLLVAPAAAVFLLIRTIFISRSVPRDLLSRLVLGLLLFTLLEALNPSGAGVVANVAGLLFTAAPLLWYFIGYEIADRALVKTVLTMWVAEAVVIALYGLMQTFSGLPAWDLAWVAVTKYPSLYVGQQLRAVGTFASAAEYAVFLAIGAVVCLVALRVRWLPILAIAGLLGYALFLESGRAVVVLTFFALLVALGLRTGRAAVAALVVVVGLAGALAANSIIGSSVTNRTATAGNPLLTHQVSGLTDPLNPEQSTLIFHLQIAVQGIQKGLSQPLGQGPGATNLASEQSGGVKQGTEVDVSNAFVNGGIVGGALYIAVMLVTLRRVWSLALRHRDAVSLCIAAVLVVSLGQWLNGGYYAVAPFIWLLVGFCNRRWLGFRAVSQREAVDPPPVPAPTLRQAPSTVSA